MSVLKALTELDIHLLQNLKDVDSIDEVDLEKQIALRGELLKKVIKEEPSIDHVEAEQLIARSRQLKTNVENLRQQLADKLKTINKGRRLIQEYQSVKNNQE
ncbi:hypothetical protein Q9290_00075 [Oceanimonas sp. CHS3-5]|uniref:hypothetical protein n=1 Tax=Oceanimonas sp. CHS3-5 TaxID=3068186 RepID=UPI00273D3EC1|nr:hypothetical protein [Oceanimonas sp. CHS3-5]MDP5290698.1 hypothetical protein [Oceanimonas sp. CHS3-5]